MKRVGPKGPFRTEGEPQAKAASAQKGKAESGDGLSDYLARRTRGWTYRGDRVTGRTRKPRERTPQVSRYMRVQQQLEGDIFNANRTYVDTTSIDSVAPSFNCIDLFAGCGGMSLGFERANYTSLLAVELDKDAAATYRRNFPSAELWADRIEDLSDEQVAHCVGDRTVHVLLAGFPCVGFSVAGQRNPKDERNVLFREVIRVAQVVQPWFIVMENVPGVVTISAGKVFEAIRSEFADIGYANMTTLVLEAASFGVAQYRPRAIFVGNRFGLANPYPLPMLESEKYASIESAIADLKDEPRNPAINHDWTYHSPEMERRISEVEPGGSLYDSYTDAWKRQYRGVPAMTVKENHGGTHLHYELDRTLSARELARLQGFPDSFFFEGRMKRVMFQVGNAVPPPLGHHVALALRPSLEGLASPRVQ